MKKRKLGKSNREVSAKGMGSMALFALVKDWVARKAATPAQISLAWLAQKWCIVPIPGTTKMPYLLENPRRGVRRVHARGAQRVERLGLSDQNTWGGKELIRGRPINNDAVLYHP
jgi:diketogulonate reductase-like aldo/keto reductase